MLFFIHRPPRPDVPVWPGRRLLASLDALVWPAALIGVVVTMPLRAGVVGALVVALAVLLSIGRLRTAIFLNHRYVMSTWRWGKPVAALLMIGLVMKVVLGLTGG
jgi:hypothetical protein